MNAKATPNSAEEQSTSGHPQQAKRSPRFAGLDGLRALAVLVVIGYHLSPGALPGGYLGVDIFFVISGFLITALLLRERLTHGRIALRAFWVRRARRLLPALALLVLACGTAAWVIGGDVLVGLGRQVVGAATFSSNWLSIAFTQSYFDESNPELFRNLWSLAVEEQFYLVWPLIVMALALLPWRWLRVTLVTLAAIASALAMAALFPAASDATRVYFGTDTHSFGLTAGAALAILTSELIPPRWLRNTLAPLGLLAIAGLITATVIMPADAAITYQGGLAAITALTLLALIGATAEGSWLGRVLDVQPLRWIGERSYGLYLWHWPVYVLLLAALPLWARTGAEAWTLGAIALAITVIASAASYRYLEQPVRTLGFRESLRRAWRAASPARTSAAGAAVAGDAAAGARPVGAGQRTLRATAAALAIIVVLASGAATAAAIIADPGRTSAQVNIEAGQDALNGVGSNDADGQAGDEAETPPGPAPLPAGEQITAIGDSVMLASVRGLQEAFPGISIDATVSRQLANAPAIIRGQLAAGTLRPTVVLGLGTNGPIKEDVLAEIRQLIGPERQLVVVNVSAPRSWVGGVNSSLTAFAQRYRDVELANWRDSIAAQSDLLANDRIHPGYRGGVVYASAVRDALQRLAELPPLLGPRDYGLAAQPV